MSIKRSGAFPRQVLLASLLAGSLLPLSAAGQEPAEASAPETPARPLVEAFQKGPVTLMAKVTRAPGKPEQAVLPLFQVPVLKYQDQLELAFSGEAFDQRVTSADWSAVVVFLPKTIAPTGQGVVDNRLRRKGDQMVIPPITVPYDSIPMIFLIPDKNARKKTLKDLNDHLQTFRMLCAKIADLSGERSTADKFLQDLDALDKNLSPAQYDNALQGFMHAYGDAVSGDLQTFLAQPRSNLDKSQFIAEEFKNTNVLVPGSTPAAPAAAAAAVVGAPPICAYVSILFDVAAIINNLWPGHQFQYLPALARNFHEFSADLYYSDWIHTTGDTRGALMCCPGRWVDQAAPAFTFELPPEESLLAGQTLLKVHLKDKDRKPFSLYGHDWKLLLTGPKGESLAPLTLTPSPNREAFVAAPGPILGALRKLGAARVKARIVGRWGFTTIAMDPVELSGGCDPAWQPSPEEKTAFQAGKACAFKLPAAWAGSVARVVFRPSGAGAAPLVASLKTLKDGSKEAGFAPKQEEAGPGTLEILAIGEEKPALARPLTLAGAQLEATGVEARVAESAVVLRGKHLRGVQALELAGRRFVAAAKDEEDGPARVFQAEDGKPLAGVPGKPLQAVLITAKGKQPDPIPVTLLPERPRLGEVEVTPGPDKHPGLPLTAAIHMLATNGSSQVSLITAEGYRFPADLAFCAAIRNADDPSVVRTIPAAKIRVIGRNQKATFTFSPNDLLGGRSAGKLEIQVQDEHAGASDWHPLPATFLDLPVVSAVQAIPSGARLVGPSLDPIEAVATAPAGPWEKADITLEGGREVMDLTTRLAGDTCYLRLIGWADLVLAVTFPPPPPPPAPVPAPEVKPAVAAPGSKPGDAGPGAAAAPGTPAKAEAPGARPAASAPPVPAQPSAPAQAHPSGKAAPEAGQKPADPATQPHPPDLAAKDPNGG
jgi:hypothetical protein